MPGTRVQKQARTMYKPVAHAMLISMVELVLRRHNHGIVYSRCVTHDQADRMRILCGVRLQAVERDAIDILAFQAPECKLLPDTVIEMISNTRSSLLIYHYKEDTKSPLSGSSFRLAATSNLTQVPEGSPAV